MMNDSRFTIKKSMSPKKSADRAHLIEGGGGNGEVAADDSRFPGATSSGGGSSSSNSYGAVQPENYGILY